MKRVIYYIIVFIVCVIICISFCKHNSVKNKDNTRYVTVSEISLSSIHTSLESIGNAIANESVDIAANITERVTDIFFSDCEYVTKGQKLVQLNLERKLAEKEQIVANLQEQERELARLKKLNQQKLIQTREYDTQYSAWLKARAALAEIEAKIKERTICAPFDGFLGIRKISIGAMVAPGTIITTLDDIKKIKVDFPLPEKYSLAIALNQPIIATSIAIPNVEFHGTISAISPRVSSISRNIMIRGIINNDNQLLRPGMMLKIKIQLNDRIGIQIPEKSLSSIGEKYFVFILNGDKVEQRFVSIGEQKNGMIEIIKGLNVGEKIVVDGVAKLMNGMKIKIANEQEGK